MFNVCSHCGQYSDIKEVLTQDASVSAATCKLCGYSHAFLALPLFVVTGASGAGKTTVALRMAEQSRGRFIVLDQDILWTDAFNAPEDNYVLFRNMWLRVIKNINQAGLPVILFGSSIPEQWESCAERRYFSILHHCALVCDDQILEARLRKRPDWRNSASPVVLEQMVKFNRWLKENAATSLPSLSLVDTSYAKLDETVLCVSNRVQQLLPASLLDSSTKF